MHFFLQAPGPGQDGVLCVHENSLAGTMERPVTSDEDFGRAGQEQVMD
ncbi:hypothetical protein SACS_0545 [Parasaccharibacter apium]|uniref:Uncharacterized protein n=1 Tax=Parasaccharibacter apium TaxID=1510841 RepID=A0A7U7G517_9PROT|nr:hypothetical protein SACS_0545 [Parasaccharibacter apium]